MHYNNALIMHALLLWINLKEQTTLLFVIYARK